MTSEQKSEIMDMRGQGLGYKDIAEKLCMPIGTVKSFLSREASKVKNTYCKNCGAKLKQTNGHRQKSFCSQKCRLQWWNSHPEAHRLKAFYNSVCLRCGRDFAAYGNNHRKYCSRDCYLQAHQTKGEITNDRP